MKVGFIKNNVSILCLALFCLLLGVFITFLVDKLENSLSIFILLIFPVALYILIKYPEIAFVLFVNAGIYKADPRLQLPGFLDLTVLFGIISIIGIIFGIIRKKIRLVIPPMKMFLPYFIIIMLAIIGFTYTEAPIWGREKLLRLLTLTSFAMFAPMFLFQSERSIRRFFIAFVLLAMAAFFDVVFSVELQMYKYGFTQAFGSSGYLGLGKFSGEALLILCFYFFFSAKTLTLKFIAIGFIIATAFLTIVSGARGSTLALGVLFVATLIFTLGNFVKEGLFLERISLVEKKRNRKLLAGFIIILCCFGFASVRFHEYFSFFLARTEQLLLNVRESVPVRLYQYHKALEVLSSFPSGLVGLGIGGFSMFAHGYDGERGIFVHNIFLDIGAELGIVGLISFSLLIYWGFTAGFRNVKKAKDEQYFTSITLLSLFLFMLLFASVHGNINDCRTLLTWLGSNYAYRRLIYQSIKERL